MCTNRQVDIEADGPTSFPRATQAKDPSRPEQEDPCSGDVITGEICKSVNNIGRYDMSRWQEVVVGARRRTDMAPGNFIFILRSFRAGSGSADEPRQETPRNVRTSDQRDRTRQKPPVTLTSVEGMNYAAAADAVARLDEFVITVVCRRG